MRYIVKVSRKGQVVIPVKIRKKYNIRDKVIIKADEEGIKIIPLIPLDEMFGIDGDIMREIAKEIIEERLEEIKRGK
ncbi:MAG: AbrB/MazE/SpoVT family DNA-binding domain-containing protein [Thermoproteales archaeon]|nr:AbrB/MazE/SpoVT family DNA-binding domain-containing protein [Thermoproteales archaeon]